MRLRKVISGGQTGVDRGALEAAIEAGVEHGGWCPLGRRAEDVRIPDRYQLAETASPKYAVRTRLNVLDSDGTLILARGPLCGGTKLTWRVAQVQGKPCLVVDPAEARAPDALRDWLGLHVIGVLNVAGPRESTCPGIQAQTKALLLRMFSE